MTDFQFASAFLPPRERREEVSLQMRSRAYLDSMIAVIYAEDWGDATKIAVGMEGDKPHDPKRPWFARIACNAAVPFLREHTHEFFYPDDAGEGRLQKRLKTLFQEAYDSGVWHLSTLDATYRGKPTAHELFVFQEEAEKWDSR
jgi:hypothetical protein